MATKSISQMDTAVAVDNGTLLEVATPDVGSASGYTSEKVSVAQLADHNANSVNYPDLQTTAKTLVGAINEAAQTGGGGTTVVANPSGTPTDTLNTVQIESTIYDIAGTGGGGASNYSENVIWSGTKTTNAVATPIEIDCNTEDYDAFVIEMENANSGKTAFFVVKNEIYSETAGSNTKPYVIHRHSNGTPYMESIIWLCCTSSKFYVYTYTGITITAKALRGIKYGGGMNEDVTSLVTPNPNLSFTDLKYSATKVGNLIFFSAESTISSGYNPQGTDTTVFTVDASIKPNRIFNNFSFGANSTPSVCRITTDGEIRQNGGGWFRFELFWVLDEGASGGEHIYSTTEHPVGRWVDGRTVYEKVITGLSLSVPARSDAWIHTGIYMTGISAITNCFCVDQLGQFYPTQCVIFTESNEIGINFQCQAARNNITTLVMQYAKSTS